MIFPGSTKSSHSKTHHSTFYTYTHTYTHTDDRMASLPAVRRLSERVITVLGLNASPFTLQGTNTYIVGTGKTRALIDTGDGVDGYMDNLVSTAAEEGIASLSPVLLSHYHHDHVGGLPGMIEVNREAQEAGNPPLFDLDAVYKYDPDTLSSPNDLEGAGVIPDGIALKALDSGAEFSVEGASLSVLHTPGHTDDSVCFYLAEEDALFSADTVLGSGSTTVFTDLGVYTHSLHSILGAFPSLGKLYPGHGDVVDNGPALIKQYIEHRAERDIQILGVLAESDDPAGQGLTPLEITKIVYAAYPPAVLPAAQRGVILHLRKLEGESRVVPTNRNDYTAPWILSSL